MGLSGERVSLVSPRSWSQGDRVALLNPAKAAAYHQLFGTFTAAAVAVVTLIGSSGVERGARMWHIISCHVDTWRNWSE